MGQNPFLYRGPEDGRLPAMARVVTVSLGSSDKAYSYDLLREVGVIEDTVGALEIVVLHTFGTSSALGNAVIADGADVGATGVYESRLDGQHLSLRRDGAVFVDAETNSTWNILGAAIDGPLRGRFLTPIVHGDHFWFSWAAFKPETVLFSPDAKQADRENLRQGRSHRMPHLFIGIVRKMMKDFSDQVFIVTGGTGNLGRAVAEALWQAGARLVIVDRSAEEKFPTTFPEWMGDDARAFASSTDLTNADAVDDMVERVLQRFGRIDGLINIAGGYRAGTPVHETPIETWDFMLNLNARTLFLASKAVLPHMIAQHSGKIVNIGARVALGGKKDMAAYSVAKTAVLRLTESISDEVKAHGINVNCVLPGTIDTPSNREAMPNANYERWVRPEALADVVLFLASDAARAVHGAAIPVYGLS